MFPPRSPTLEDKNTINQLLSNTGIDKPSSGLVKAAGKQQATSDTKNSFISAEKNYTKNSDFNPGFWSFYAGAYIKIAEMSKSYISCTQNVSVR